MQKHDRIFPYTSIIPQTLSQYKIFLHGGGQAPACKFRRTLSVTKHLLRALNIVGTSDVPSRAAKKHRLKQK